MHFCQLCFICFSSQAIEVNYSPVGLVTDFFSCHQETISKVTNFGQTGLKPSWRRAEPGFLGSFLQSATNIEFFNVSLLYFISAVLILPVYRVCRASFCSESDCHSGSLSMAGAPQRSWAPIWHPSPLLSRPQRSAGFPYQSWWMLNCLRPLQLLSRLGKQVHKSLPAAV